MLRQKIDLLVRKLCGAQSEKIDPAQLLLLLQGMDEPGTERSEIDCRRQPQGWSGSDIKCPEPVAGSPTRQPPVSPPPPRRRPQGARRANRLRVNAGLGCRSICQ